MNKFLIISQVSAIIGDSIILEQGDRYYWNVDSKELCVDFGELEFIFSGGCNNLTTRLALTHVAVSNGMKVF